jgi:hypothetical protein
MLPLRATSVCQQLCHAPMRLSSRMQSLILPHPFRCFRLWLDFLVYSFCRVFTKFHLSMVWPWSNDRIGVSWDHTFWVILVHYYHSALFLIDALVTSTAQRSRLGLIHSMTYPVHPMTQMGNFQCSWWMLRSSCGFVTHICTAPVSSAITK